MSGLSSSAWFTGDDGPADPPSERPVPPVAAPEVHEAECHCDSFSDCYKDVTGRRPRDEIARWTCARVTQWFHENYIETSPRHFGPRVPFEGEPAPRTLPVTPAERCLAGMLRAWLDYSPSDECNVDQQNALADIGNRLRRLGVTNTLKATPAGAALLARVEAAERTPTPARADAFRALVNLGLAPEIAKSALDFAHVELDPAAPITWGPRVRAVLRDYAAGATPIDAPPAKEPAPLVSIRACKHPRASGDCYACPDCGVINNCNLENGEPESACQMCPGKCPNRAQYAAKEPSR